MRSWGWSLFLLLLLGRLLHQKSLEDVQKVSHDHVIFTSLHLSHLFIELLWTREECLPLSSKWGGLIPKQLLRYKSSRQGCKPHLTGLSIRCQFDTR
jgi:hypothetical protein